MKIIGKTFKSLHLMPSYVLQRNFTLSEEGGVRMLVGLGDYIQVS